LHDALLEIHFPTSLERLERAKSRLGFEEVFMIQLFLMRQRANLKNEPAPQITFDETLVKEFVASLPFKMTQDQRKAAWDIFQDIAKKEPMNRLLNGDVGSGKTLVAALASYLAVKRGWQVAFIVPTEVLSWQHYQTLTSLFKDSGFDIALMTSSQNKLFLGGKQQSHEESNMEIASMLSAGQIPFVIGTHALLQEHVSFEKLGMVIIDEQHRFGVAQRAKLLNAQRLTPHLLSMTATPIPRTLSLAIYGDLDISFLAEMPKGRRTIHTTIVPYDKRERMHEFIRTKVKQQEQIFVICPRIEPNADNADFTQTNAENLYGPQLSASSLQKSALWEMKAVETEYEKLKKIFPEYAIAKMHGRMKPKEKEKIFGQMRDKKIDMLVSTSVIEVGIDMPDATIVVVENAERFGLAQLHQIRGRIGRAGQESWCFLVTDNEHSERLMAMANTSDGFKLAEKDLELRGPGEFFGTQQWGIPELTIGSLTDLKTVQTARNEAHLLLENDPKLQKYPALKEKFAQWQSSIHLE
jgi:ATP-dependent DNA helicase RecG